jgi:hypothetical protein
VSRRRHHSVEALEEAQDMTDGFIWEEASVSYPDWSGRAQLDQRKTAAGLLEVVGLDPKRWMVVGLDIGGSELGYDLKVVAVDRKDVPPGGDVFPKIAAANDGEIPATEFAIHNMDPYDVLRAITHVFELRLRTRGSRDIPIRIVAQSDVPEQP